MAVDKRQTLLRVIEKIPMFAGLGMESVKNILQVCESRGAEVGEVLCKVGDPSNEMLILLSGRLGVFTEARVQVAVVAPVAPVGEMGLITGQPRSATVLVVEKANLLVIRKAAFDRLIRQSGEICAQVHRNVIQTLSQRLRDTRLQVKTATAELADLEGQLDRLKEEIQGLRGSRVSS